jgi:hypothetical protein
LHRFCPFYLFKLSIIIEKARTGKLFLNVGLGP